MKLLVRLIALLPERVRDVIETSVSKISNAIEDAQHEAYYREHPWPDTNPHQPGTVQHIAWEDANRLRKQFCTVLSQTSPWQERQRGIFPKGAGIAVRSIVAER